MHRLLKKQQMRFDFMDIILLRGHQHVSAIRMTIFRIWGTRIQT